MPALVSYTRLVLLAPLRRRWDGAALRAKTLVIIAVTVAALLVLIYIPLRLFVLDSYLRLEAQQVLTDVQRGANALADDQADLARIAAGLAVRDAHQLFDAAAAGDRSRLGLVAIADERGRILQSRGFDPVTGAEAIPLLARGAQLPAGLEAVPPSGRSGLFTVRDTLLLVAAHPVPPVDTGSGGFVLVARPLDRAMVRELAARTRLELTVHPLDATYPAPDVVTARDALVSQPGGVTRPLGARTIAGYRLLHDINGRPVAVLRIQAGRPAYEQGQASVAYFAMALLFVTFVSGAAAVELLERSVVARQTRLSAAMLAIGETGDLSARVAVRGSDEIARLGDAINTMLSSLERAQGERRAAFQQLSVLTEQLRRSRDILRTLFDGLDDGMALVDGTGSVLAANQRFAELHGNTPNELVGALSQQHDARQHQQGMALIQTTVQASLADGRARRERIAHDAAHAHRVLDLRVLPLLDQAGRVDQAVVHVTDVTERLRLEAAVIGSERFAAGARLAAAVAHELNTPLQSIQSCLDLVRLAAPAQRETYLTIAQEEIRRISTILRSLLAIHRPSGGQAAGLDVNPLIERLLLLTSGTLGDRSVYVECDLASELPPALAQADQLTQVLLNLVMNAADAMPAGGTITLRTSAATECIRIEVSDTGSGVPPAIRARIFDPFFTTKPEGSGLGLAISRQIIEDHGGRLTLADTPAGGATFVVQLPVSPLEAYREQALAKNATVGGPGRASPA
jgi:PAS domain S-box-containing protein